MIEKSLSSLNPLETFKKEVFVGDDKYSQDLCNFVLTLSLIWNDTKNIALYLLYINSLKQNDKKFISPEDMPISPCWGEIAGIETYTEKLFIALIHELFNLIRKSKNVIESDCFNIILKQLHKSCRESWQVIINYAFGKADSNTPFGKALLMVRNKIANHYDKDEIFKGYQKKFINTSNDPCISRGNKMLEQRFYFADASAQEYYRSHQQRVSVEEFYKNIYIIRDSINLAIQNLVETFIQKRSPWKQIKQNS